MELDRNRRWMTFKGRATSFAETDHQHLSNIYYFNKYVNNQEEFCKLVLDEINWRFNGQLLPYRPHPQFQYEMDILRSKGMFIPTGPDNHVPKILIIEPNTTTIIGEILNHTMESLFSQFKTPTDESDIQK